MKLLHLCCITCALSMVWNASAQQIIQNEPISVTYKTVKRQKGKYYRINVVYPVFPNNLPAGQLANRLIRKVVNEELEPFANERQNVETGRQYDTGIWLEIKPKVVMARRTLISLYLDVDSFGGGAHESRYFYTINVGVVDGKPKQLRFSDILQKGMSAQKVFVEQVIPLLNEAKAKRGERRLTGETLEEALGQGPPFLWDRFVIAPNEVIWLFEPYSVGPFSEGSYIIRVPRQRLERFLRVSW